MTAPNPQTWTLRLKSRKTTVLLHIDPLSTFDSIKAQLYTALRDTGLKDPETGASIPLPDSSSDIQLGRPIDTHDAQQGFQLGEWERPAEESEEDGTPVVVAKPSSKKAKQDSSSSEEESASEDDDDVVRTATSLQQ